MYSFCHFTGANENFKLFSVIRRKELFSCVKCIAFCFCITGNTVVVFQIDSYKLTLIHGFAKKLVQNSETLLYVSALGLLLGNSN